MGCILSTFHVSSRLVVKTLEIMLVGIVNPISEGFLWQQVQSHILKEGQIYVKSNYKYSNPSKY